MLPHQACPSIPLSPQSLVGAFAPTKREGRGEQVEMPSEAACCSPITTDLRETCTSGLLRSRETMSATEMPAAVLRKHAASPEYLSWPVPLRERGQALIQVLAAPISPL